MNSEMIFTLKSSPPLSFVSNAKELLSITSGQPLVIDANYEELAKKVDLRLKEYPKLLLTKDVLENSNIYVDKNGKENSKISLKQIKQLNTKITLSDSLSNVNFNELEDGDFIYIKI